MYTYRISTLSNTIVFKQLITKTLYRCKKWTHIYREDRKYLYKTRDDQISMFQRVTCALTNKLKLILRLFFSQSNVLNQFHSNMTTLSASFVSFQFTSIRTRTCFCDFITDSLLKWETLRQSIFQCLQGSL